jgi:hypothetical protein
MRVAWLGTICLSVFGLIGTAVPVQARDNVEDAKLLAAQIDKLIGAKQAKEKVIPAPLSGDGEFFRRVCLDLQGRIPTVTEMRDFIDDDRANKRWIWVEEMLTGKDEDGKPTAAFLYPSHFATVWRRIILPGNNNPQNQFFASAMENWLRGRLSKNVSYDKIARELLTAPVFQNFNGRGGATNSNPSAFYQLNEFKPENLAASTSRLLLGVKLECAQCHDHPFAKWTKNQFWEYAAFFAGISNRGVEQPNVRKININGTPKTADAKFLDGTEPKWQDGKSTRAVLADWIARADNPYFAKATVNKVWAYFFGVGLIDPVDEESDENPPSHPELLDLLAKEFAAHDFDLKFLIRAIVASRTYQLTSRATDPSQSNPRLFSRAQVRGLTPEQLFDSVAVAIDYKDGSAPQPNQQFNPNFLGSPRAQFLARFSNQDKANETETSILQALFMMNGKFMAEATSLKYNKFLYQIAVAPEKGKDPKKIVPLPRKIEQLYLIALSRLPNAKESARLIKYIEGGGKTGDRNKAFEDIFWALLNSAEFRLNH